MFIKIKDTVFAAANTLIKQSVIHHRLRYFKTLAALSSSSDVLKVKLLNEDLEFPHSWLRENCQCDKCFHQSAKSRIIDWNLFEIGIKPSSVEETVDAVKIIWEDGHHSKFTHNWLKLRSFKPEHKKIYSETVYKPKKITWNGADFEKVCTRHDYKKILTSDIALHDWLETLAVYGVNILENTPNNETASNDVIKAIGFPKQTHYGVNYIVQNVSNTSNVAYLSAKLPMHVDLPYYEYCPGVNILQCLVQSQSNGGKNHLSDAHFTANFLKENHPEQFKLLSELDVEWCDIGVDNGNEFFKLHRAPVITLDKHGEILRIRFSIPQRGSNFPFDISYVKPWYEAHKLFLQLNEDFAGKFKLKAGETLAFDNSRLLHGRSEYVDSAANVRKLIGTFVDWDEIYSRLRCLKLKLNKMNGIDNN